MSVLENLREIVETNDFDIIKEYSNNVMSSEQFWNDLFIQQMAVARTYFDTVATLPIKNLVPLSHLKHDDTESFICDQGDHQFSYFIDDSNSIPCYIPSMVISNHLGLQIVGEERFDLTTYMPYPRMNLVWDTNNFTVRKYEGIVYITIKGEDHFIEYSFILTHSSEWKEYKKIGYFVNDFDFVIHSTTEPSLITVVDNIKQEKCHFHGEDITELMDRKGWTMPLTDKQIFELEMKR